MTLQAELFKLLKWTEENDGELTFAAGGVQLFDNDGDLIASSEGFNESNGARLLAELLEGAVLASASAPAPMSPFPICAVDRTWFGLGMTPFEWGERKTIKIVPDRAFNPERLVVPASLAGYLLYQQSHGGITLFANESGVPIEFFSELSTAPHVLYPSLGPDQALELDIRAPHVPKAPPPFTGALYGMASK